MEATNYSNDHPNVIELNKYLHQYIDNKYKLNELLHYIADMMQNKYDENKLIVFVGNAASGKSTFTRLIESLFENDFKHINRISDLFKCQNNIKAVCTKELIDLKDLLTNDKFYEKQTPSFGLIVECFPEDIENLDIELMSKMKIYNLMSRMKIYNFNSNFMGMKTSVDITKFTNEFKWMLNNLESNSPCRCE